jgi:hypothetical protein
MKHIDGSFESDGVDRPVGIAPMVLYNLQDAGAFTLPWFRLGMLPAKLSHTQCVPDFVFDGLRKGQQVSL